MAVMRIDNNRMLSAVTDTDGVIRFELTQPTMLWRFPREQLVAEIVRLQTELVQKQALLVECDKLTTAPAAPVVVA
jgi:hypothetical protein